ncbi:MAG: DUF6882 domain-containing protein [Granulosicoccus sp.]
MFHRTHGYGPRRTLPWQLKAGKKVLAVQKYSDTSKFVNLTIPLWSADETDGWEMTAVAVELLDAKGAYRTPGSGGFTYLALMDISWVS